MGAFIHFGINTFAGREWSDGTLPPEVFDPSDLDAREWAATARRAGARYLVLTAKHHDGFCLWPTVTTDYSVASSPWRGGKGDLVREVAEACAAEGLGLGLYLSPWDRNAECYENPAAYDEFYARQLTELCTGYGPLVELWFDGAGSDGREYDWPRFMEIIWALQPGAMVFNMGTPTIRWIGNEDGLASEPVLYAADRSPSNQYTASELRWDDVAYMPPECDVSLRRKWFWHPDDEPKSTEHLLAIYYRSVGLGANLLLNIPPDARGRIDSDDAARLAEWRAELDRRLSGPITAQLVVSGGDDGNLNVLLQLQEAQRVTHIELVEELSSGQRVSGHEVLLGDEVIAKGTTIGVRRLHRLHAPVTGDRFTVRLSGPIPRLKAARVYTGDPDAPHVPVPGIPEGYIAPTETPEALV